MCSHQDFSFPSRQWMDLLTSEAVCSRCQLPEATSEEIQFPESPNLKEQWRKKALLECHWDRIYFSWLDLLPGSLGKRCAMLRPNPHGWGSAIRMTLITFYPLELDCVLRSLRQKYVTHSHSVPSSWQALAWETRIHSVRICLLSFVSIWGGARHWR